MYQNDWPSFLERDLSSKRFELRGRTLDSSTFSDAGADGSIPFLCLAASSRVAMQITKDKAIG
jgi:hypothetical protein